jgi:hypothetical protein
VLETGTDTRVRNKKRKNRSQTRMKQNDGRSRLTPIAAGSLAKNEAYSSDEKESVDRGCRGMAGGIRPPLEGAEVSDEWDCRRRVTDVDDALPHAVYTSVQMLEIHSKNCHFCHFSGPSTRLPGGKARSARRCNITRSDMSCAGPGHPGTEWVEVHRNCHTDFR